MGVRVLLAGESWVKHVTHVKGFDSFHTSDYTEGATHFVESMRAAGHVVTYVPCHEVPSRFPRSADELTEYDVVILSDVGSNTFLLPPDTFKRSEAAPNVLAALAEFVTGGGGLVMIGGYMSFAGIDGRARYGATALGPVLPVEVLDYDDRVEVPEGFTAQVIAADHDALSGTDPEWPPLLGYNRLLPRKDSEVLALNGDDPILVVGWHGEGRTVAFASDLAPHWAPPGFVEWEGYVPLWDSLLRWAGGGQPATDAPADAMTRMRT